MINKNFKNKNKWKYSNNFSIKKQDKEVNRQQQQCKDKRKQNIKINNKQFAYMTEQSRADNGN